MTLINALKSAKRSRRSPRFFSEGAEYQLRYYEDEYHIAIYFSDDVVSGYRNEGRANFSFSEDRIVTAISEGDSNIVRVLTNRDLLIYLPMKGWST